MFRVFKTYRHKRCLDVDIYILKVKYRGPKYIKLRVAWVLRSSGGILWDRDEIVVQRKDLSMWSEV